MNSPKVLPGRLVPSSLRFMLAAVCAACSFAGTASAESQQPSTSTLKIEALGKGAVPLDGPWQFHPGDRPEWAAPKVDDTSGHDGWEQLNAGAP